jgi:hypothetical protein
VARVPATAFRDGLRAVRASGWRGPALALLAYVPIAVTFAVFDGALLFAGLVLHVVVVVALVRLLGAVRPVPVPPVPAVDEAGHRIAPRCAPARR